MTRLLISIFIICWAVNAHTQIVGLRVEKYIAEKSIDTFLVYSFICSDGVSQDSCQNDEPNFLIWKQKENYYLKMFEYCKTYKTVSLSAANPLTYYLQNKAIIDTEEIKLPTYLEVKKSRNRVDSHITTSSASHSCYHKFQLPSANEVKYKYVSTYDLNFKAFDDGKENVYYSYNQNTHLKRLIDLTTRLIKGLQADEKLKPE